MSDLPAGPSADELGQVRTPDVAGMQNATLHPQLQSSLTLLPTDRHVALLTRHSIREWAKDGIANYTLPLTPEGVQLAREWGASLGRPVSAFYSSPVGRCVDTATAMMAGAGIELPVQTVSTLVEPGCFVEKMRLAGPTFLSLGPLAFVRQHFYEAVPGLVSPRAGTAKLLQHMHQAQGEPGALSVHVTHDTILALCVYHLLQQHDIEDVHWPWMMEGAFVWFDEECAHLLWRGQQYHFDHRDYLSET